MNYLKKISLLVSMIALTLSQGVSADRRELPQTDWNAVVAAFREMPKTHTFRATFDAEFVKIDDLKKMNNGTGASVRKYGVVVFDPPLSAAQLLSFPYSAMLQRQCAAPGDIVWKLQSGDVILDVTNHVKIRS